MPEATKPTATLGLIERLEHVRAVGIDPGRGHAIHQARLSQLAREAEKTTVQYPYAIPWGLFATKFLDCVADSLCPVTTGRCGIPTKVVGLWSSVAAVVSLSEFRNRECSRGAFRASVSSPGEGKGPAPRTFRCR